MLGIADISKILKDRLKDTPVRVDVEYTSHQKSNDMIRVVFWFPIFSFKNRWWSKYGCSFFMSEESRCVENLRILINDMLTKYIEMMLEVNPQCRR